MRRLFVPLMLSLVSVACGGTQRLADADWSPEPEHHEKRGRETEALNAAKVDPIEERPTALLGVRHDLMLSNGPHDARCPCLSVEIGAPADERFFWSGGAPEIGSNALAIAVGARGIACPGGPPDDRRRRPSISAVDQENDDIFVEIEDLPEGRPLASGAIIPKPGSRGAVFVYPRRGNLVYGRSAGGSRCRVR